MEEEFKAVLEKLEWLKLNVVSGAETLSKEDLDPEDKEKLIFNEEELEALDSVIDALKDAGI